MQSFLIDRWIKLVIDGFTNLKKKVKIGISQGLFVSPILFLIYISKVLSKIKRKIPSITYLSFMDDLRFLIVGYLVSHIAKILEDAGKIALKWGSSNAISYDISKTEAILFLKSKLQKLASQLFEIRLHFGGEVIVFSKKTTRWLGIWLDSCLNFNMYFNERIKSGRQQKLGLKVFIKYIDYAHP